MISIPPTPEDSSKLSEDSWQYLGNRMYRHQIYSAYFDGRPEILGNDNEYAFGSVRLFAILTTYMKTRIYCNFVFEKGRATQIPALSARPIKENGQLKFSAYTIVCPLINQGTESTIVLPMLVAISYDEDMNTLIHPTYVPIKYHKEGTAKEPDRTLAVCTGPIHDNYSEARRLVEFIHIYKLMGAEKLYFYNLTATTSVNAVLEYFGKQESVQVLDWNLHGYKFEVELRYAGIFAALNECVYRATFVDGFKYVAIVDLDEILVSLEYSNLVEYLKSVDSKKTGSYVFRGVFLHSSDENDLTDIPYGIRNNFLYTQTKTLRTVDPFPPHDRSKYIVKGRTAIEMGNHFMWQSIGGYVEKQIPAKEALLFHFRKDCLQKTCHARKIKDLTFRRYGALLWDLMEKSCKDIFPDGICPIS